MTEDNWASRLVLFFIVCCAILYCAHLIFLSPALYDPDSYYNIAMAGFIKNLGFHYQFRWAQFSILKNHFADKDLLLHIFCVPFLYLAGDPVSAAKHASLFLAILFLVVYVYLLRRYVPSFLAGLILLLPFYSPAFSVYLIELRSATLMNIALALGIYYLINKRHVPLFVLSLLYALAHVSSYAILFLAVSCEILRHIFKREFYPKNILACLAGVALGAIVHPNFPKNLLIAYLNGVLAPIYSVAGIDLGFSGETRPLDIGFALTNNLIVFFILAIVISIALTKRRKLEFATIVWLAASLLYLGCSLLSSRFWYQANAISPILFASTLKDMKGKGGRFEIPLKVRRPIAISLAVCLCLLPLNVSHSLAILDYLAKRSLHYEDVGRWMKLHIPDGHTIYHGYWDDAEYFLCLNPKNNYINTNDPIYMFYSHPKELVLLDNLSMGKIGNPQEAIGKIFLADYGYVRKEEPLYRQIADDKRHFNVLYERNEGVVFALRKNSSY